MNDNKTKSDPVRNTESLGKKSELDLHRDGAIEDHCGAQHSEAVTFDLCVCV